MKKIGKGKHKVLIVLKDGSQETYCFKKRSARRAFIWGLGLANSLKSYSFTDTQFEENIIG